MRLTVASLISGIALVIAAVPAQLSAVESGNPIAREDLFGTWKVVATEVDGAPSDFYVGSRYIFKKDEVRFYYPSKTNRFAVYGWHLDVSKSPARLDMTPKRGKVSLGIIKKDGDRLVYCSADGGLPIPTTFATQKKDGRILWTLERERDEERGGPTSAAR